VFSVIIIVAFFNLLVFQNSVPIRILAYSKSVIHSNKRNQKNSSLFEDESLVGFSNQTFNSTYQQLFNVTNHTEFDFKFNNEEELSTENNIVSDQNFLKINFNQTSNTKVEDTTKPTQPIFITR